jgi:hypothetical protein
VRRGKTRPYPHPPFRHGNHAVRWILNGSRT